MILFENRFFADITKVITEMRSLGWALNPMKESVLIRNRKGQKRTYKYSGAKAM